MVKVGQLRYIQSTFENVDFKNPDEFVFLFLSFLQKINCVFIGKIFLPILKNYPFYYYLLARTKYYDEIFSNAIDQGYSTIVNIGCGLDTRAIRFNDMLVQKNVRVFEFDVPKVLKQKQVSIGELGSPKFVEYLPIDINNKYWSELEALMINSRMERMLVLMEGVSPYICGDAFCQFLRFLSFSLSAGSKVCYDYKNLGANDRFGSPSNRRKTFRLQNSYYEVEAFHKKCNFELIHFESSVELSTRMLSGLKTSKINFTEDSLIQILV
jgi:methyltransferase (TIGR00027 family)